jgi:hypothetical protein
MRFGKPFFSNLLGEISVQPLTSLLSSISEDGQKRHFARGKEREGAMAWAKHEAGDDSDGLWRFEITSRLIYDTCEILGRLGAVESVPVLMEVVETENQFGGFTKETAAVRALKMLGKPATPHIPSRAAHLLISIGDESVLPVLRSLLDETQYRNASGHAKYAIGMIERGEKLARPSGLGHFD